MRAHLHSPHKYFTMSAKSMPDGAPQSPCLFEGTMLARAGPPMPVRMPRVRYGADADADLRELQTSWYAVDPDDSPHALFGVQPRGEGFVR